VATIQGQVKIGGGAVAGSTVTLWEASAGAPREIGHALTNTDGHFSIRTTKPEHFTPPKNYTNDGVLLRGQTTLKVF
jgi:hypothetical protein